MLFHQHIFFGASATLGNLLSTLKRQVTGRATLGHAYRGGVWWLGGMGGMSCVALYGGAVFLTNDFVPLFR